MDIPIIIAAGGLVTNASKELLFIYRRGFWDLPKGKLDEGESIEACAVREVQEETGLKNIVQGPLLGITEHTYFDKYVGKTVIKKTYWYTMQVTENQVLIPQAEEDIEVVKWANEAEIKLLLQKTYPNIQDIVSKYLQHK